MLELHYADRTSAELFAEEEHKLTREIEAVRAEASGRRQEDLQLDELVARFEQVAGALRYLDVSRVWEAATGGRFRRHVDSLS